MRRRHTIILLAFLLYGLSMLASFGQAGAVTRGIASLASDLTPATGAAPTPYPYGNVTICHVADKKGGKTTITVDQASLPAHLAHGDTLGPCP